MRAVLIADDKAGNPFVNLPNGGGKALRCTLHLGTLRATPEDPKAFSGVQIPGCLILRRGSKLIFQLPSTSKYSARPIVTKDIAEGIVAAVEAQPIASEIGTGFSEDFAQLAAEARTLTPIKHDIFTAAQ